jgi:prephenate dehydrogenase
VSASRSHRLDTAAIVGTGLIGGAIGMALRKRGIARRVIAVDQDPHVARRAVQRGAADITGPMRSLADAELVIVAVPLDPLEDVCRAAAGYLRPGAILSDTGSVKAPIVSAIERSTPNFVGGHPMAGTEKQGIEHADASFLGGRPYLLTATGFTNKEAVERMAEVVHALDMVPIVLQPEVHDRLVALVSHLPYLIAAAVVRTAANERESLDLGGPTFREMARVAANPSGMWDQITRANRHEVLRALAEFRSHLDRMETALRTGTLKPQLQDVEQLGSIARQRPQARSS